MHPYLHGHGSAWLNNRENREVAAVNRITLHITRYISVYVGWLTFDAVNFGAYRYKYWLFHGYQGCILYTPCSRHGIGDLYPSNRII